MNIGEIKIEALKLMFVNYGFNITTEDLTTIESDENYGSYLVNMEGSILRALDRIENNCVLPLKTKIITKTDYKERSNYLELDLTEIEDFCFLERIIETDVNGLKNTHFQFEIEGNDLILENKNSSYKLIYYPKIIFKETLTDSTDIPIPNNIARLIPYFVKSELYQEEEPALASEARNLFEASLEDLKRQTYSKQNYIEKVISFY